MVPTSFHANHSTTLPKGVAQSDKISSLKIMFKEIVFVLASLEGGPWILGHKLVENLAMNPPLDWFNMNFVGLLSFGHLAIVSTKRRPKSLYFLLTLILQKLVVISFCWGGRTLWVWNLHVPS